MYVLIFWIADIPGKKMRKKIIGSHRVGKISGNEKLKNLYQLVIKLEELIKIY